MLTLCGGPISKESVDQIKKSRRHTKAGFKNIQSIYSISRPLICEELKQCVFNYMRTHSSACLLCQSHLLNWEYFTVELLGIDSVLLQNHYQPVLSWMIWFTLIAMCKISSDKVRNCAVGVRWTQALWGQLASREQLTRSLCCEDGATML